MKQKQYLGVSTHPRVCGFASKNIYKKNKKNVEKRWIIQYHIDSLITKNVLLRIRLIVLVCFMERFLIRQGGRI